MSDMDVGDKVTISAGFNRRYQGRAATIVERASNGRYVVKLDRYTPGLDALDGRVWLRPGELELVERADPDRREVAPEEAAMMLAGARVDSVEVGRGWIILRLGKLTLYADEPTLYRTVTE